MASGRLPSRLLVVSDRSLAPRPLTETAEAVFSVGGCWILLRERDLAASARRALAEELMAQAGRHGCTLSVAGDLETAAALGAGLHLPRDGDVAGARRRLGPDALIGLSAHDLAEARRAEAEGADYVTFSPVFESISKPGYGPDGGGGLKGLAEVTAALSIPVMALGGVTRERVADCLAAGARGVAVLGEVMPAEDPAGAVRGLVEALDSA